MKLKLVLPLVLLMGFSGTASAIIIDPVGLGNFVIIGDGILPNPGGIETDNYSQTVNNVGAAGVAVDNWIGISMIGSVAHSNITAEAQSIPPTPIVPLNIELYAVASMVGTNWTPGALLDSSFPSPLLATLTTGTYMLRFLGTLPGPLAGTLDYNYGVRISSDVSAIPIPAAAWLFGTAMMGLIGLRRKTKMAAAA